MQTLYGLNAIRAGVFTFLVFVGLEAISMQLGWSSHISWPGAIGAGIGLAGLTYWRKHGERRSGGRPT